jgi:hypothetical protein
MRTRKPPQADGPLLEPQSSAASGPPWVAMDRRGFLRSTAGGAAAVVLAGILPAGCGADYPQAATDGADLVLLTAKEYAVVRAAAEAMLMGAPVNAADVARAIDRELLAVGDPVRSDFRSVLSLIEHFTLLSWHRRTFTELRPEERLGYLRGWATSRFGVRRAAFQALRGFVQYFAYIRPETRPLTLFSGPPRDITPPVLVRIVDYGEIA